MEILVGCDPEIFLRHKKTRHVVSAHGIVPGTKHEPFKVEKGAIQVDGMALEFNIDPAATAEEFEGNIKTVLEQLREMVPSELDFAIEPTATFTKAHFDKQPDCAKELGCEPDYNAYTLEENPRPDNATTMRTAAGHVHVGLKGCVNADISSLEHMVLCAQLVKHMDLFLGIPSLLYDTDNKRRIMYGKPGAFRPKPYGVEYRVLSNAWLKDPRLIRWVFTQTQKTVNDLEKVKGNSSEHAGDLMKCWFTSPHPILNKSVLKNYLYNYSLNAGEIMEGFPEL
jgi:hypothetical protein